MHCTTIINKAPVLLATINAQKINDFILATAMVRASLDQNGVYDKYKKAYRFSYQKDRLVLFILRIENS